MEIFTQLTPRKKLFMFYCSDLAQISQNSVSSFLLKQLVHESKRFKLTYIYIYGLSVTLSHRIYLNFEDFVCFCFCERPKLLELIEFRFRKSIAMFREYLRKSYMFMVCKSITPPGKHTHTHTFTNTHTNFKASFTPKILHRYLILCYGLYTLWSWYILEDGELYHDINVCTKNNGQKIC